MRTSLSALVLTVCGLAVAGPQPVSRIQVGPVSEVVYADGSAAPDGECYELVFTAAGHDFAGFTADGHFKEPQHSVVATYGSLDEIRTGIECTLGTSAQTKAEYLDTLGCSDGVFELYLLDTRTNDGFAPIDEDDTYLPTKINAWAKANGSGAIRYSSLVYDYSPGVNSGTISSTQKTVVGSVTPVPVIAAFARVGGVSRVSVTNTVLTANYVLMRASDVGFANVLWTSSAIGGATEADAPVVFEDVGASESPSFYRIKVVAK